MRCEGEGRRTHHQAIDISVMAAMVIQAGECDDHSHHSFTSSPTNINVPLSLKDEVLQLRQRQ
jgi:hypothetical protein